MPTCAQPYVASLLYFSRLKVAGSVSRSLAVGKCSYTSTVGPAAARSYGGFEAWASGASLANEDCVEGLPRRVKALLSGRIEEDLPQEEGRATTGEEYDGRSDIHRGEDEARRSDADQRVNAKASSGGLNGEQEHEAGTWSTGEDRLSNAGRQEWRHVCSSGSRRYLSRQQNSPKSYSLPEAEIKDCFKPF